MFVRKITIKSVCGSNPDITAVIAAGKLGSHVLRVAGRANRIITRPSPYDNDGEKVSRGLAGDFVAIDPDSGNRCESTRAFLPPVIQESVAAALAAKSDDPMAVIEFGFDVYAVLSPRDANKYEYRVQPFKAVESHSAAAELLEMAPAFKTVQSITDAATKAKRKQHVK